MTDEEFVVTVAKELKRARAKFPRSNATMAALVEEVGEVAKALMYEPWDAVINEAAQVACMAQRLATEGDQTMRAFRLPHVRYQRDGDLMPWPADEPNMNNLEPTGEDSKESGFPAPTQEKP